MSDFISPKISFLRDGLTQMQSFALPTVSKKKIFMPKTQRADKVHFYFSQTLPADGDQAVMQPWY